jgi:hypothetical protein
MNRAALSTLQRYRHRGRTELAALARWWLSIVREAANDLLRHWAPNQAWRTTLRLGAAGTGQILQEIRNGKLTSVEFQVQPALPARSSVHVLLPQSMILLNRIWLPAAAQSSLERIIELRLERELPLPRAQVQVGWHVEAHSADGKRIRVAIAAIRNSELARVREALRRWQLRALSIRVEMEASRAAFSFAAYDTPSLQHASHVDRWLAASAVVMLLASMGVTIGQWLHERVVVERAIAALRAPAERIAMTRAELTRRRAPLLALQPLQRAASVAEVLATLTPTIASDSWLPQLEIRSNPGNTSLQLTVMTPSAAALLDRLENSPYFERVELRTSSNTGDPFHRDRAELTARWSDGGAPRLPRASGVSQQ